MRTHLTSLRSATLALVVLLPLPGWGTQVQVLSQERYARASDLQHSAGDMDDFNTSASRGPAIATLVSSALTALPIHAEATTVAWNYCDPHDPYWCETGTSESVFSFRFRPADQDECMIRIHARIKVDKGAFAEVSLLRELSSGGEVQVLLETRMECSDTSGCSKTIELDVIEDFCRDGIAHGEFRIRITAMTLFGYPGASAEFQADVGFLPTAVSQTTWSQVKTLFRGPSEASR